MQQNGEWAEAKSAAALHELFRKNPSTSTSNLSQVDLDFVGHKFMMKLASYKA